jgi:chemotaxis signal transduction protein
MDEQNRFLVVSLEKEHFALPLANLIEITVPRAVHKDPQLSPLFAGAMEYRGSRIPVADLKKLLKLPGRPGASLVVMKSPAGMRGFLVDTALELVTAAESPAPLPRGLISGSHRAYAGIFRGRDGLVLLLDVDGLLA